MLKITEILTTTLEDIFGSKEKQYFRDVGIPCKPNPEVWEAIKSRFVGFAVLYLGDKLNDVRFIANGKDIHGIVVPVNEDNRQEVEEFIARSDLEARVTIADRASLAKILPEKIKGLDNGSGVYLGVDLDDTLMPDLYRAQKVAVKKMLEFFRKNRRSYPLNLQLDDYTVSFIADYEDRIVNVQGSDRQLALASIYILEGNNPFYIDQDAIEALKGKYIGEKGKELVDEINTRVGIQLFAYDPQADIICEPFRKREAREARNLIRRGDLHIFQPVYDGLVEARQIPGLTLGIITNKTKTVVDAIYNMDIQVR